MAALSIDPKVLLPQVGMVGLFAIIFAETGLLIGFFLPGDSLLVLAGLVRRRQLKKAGLDMATPNLGISWWDKFSWWFRSLGAAGPATTSGARAVRRCSSGSATPNASVSSPATSRSAHHYFREVRRQDGDDRPVRADRAHLRQPDGRRRRDGALRTFTTYNVIGGTAWTVGRHHAGLRAGQDHSHAEKQLVVIEGVIIALSLVCRWSYEVVRARQHSAEVIDGELTGGMQPPD